MRKRPVIVARPWETSLKLSRTLHSSALRSTWTARWGPADDLPLMGKNQCVRDAHPIGGCMSARGPNAKSGSVRLCAACGGWVDISRGAEQSRFMNTRPYFNGAPGSSSLLLKPMPATEIEATGILPSLNVKTARSWRATVPYAPRTGGAYDSRHRTAGIAGRTRRRGGRVAARGARAAGRKDTPISPVLTSFLNALPELGWI